MQTTHIRRVLAGLTLASWLAACSGSADNPYASIKDAPLAAGKLYTVTLVTDDAALAQTLEKKGFTTLALPTNYPAADRVEVEEAEGTVVGGAGDKAVPAGEVAKSPGDLEPEVVEVRRPDGGGIGQGERGPHRFSDASSKRSRQGGSGPAYR